MPETTTKTTQPAAPQQASKDTFFRKPGEGFFDQKPLVSPVTAKFYQSIQQKKLEVNQPGDAYEKEADAVADKVMRMPAPVPAAPPSEKADELQRKETDKEDDKMLTGEVDPTPLQRKEEEEEMLQAKGEGTPDVTPSFEASLQQSKGSGSPLPGGVKTRMESGIGADFSNVRVHTGTQAAQLSSSIQAQAFTHGKDIYFNEGKYSPGTDSGKHLLAHELTHTVQQGGAAVQRQDGDPENKTQTTVGDGFVVDTKELKNFKVSKSLYPGVLEDAYLKVEIRNLAQEKIDAFLPSGLKQNKLKPPPPKQEPKMKYDPELGWKPIKNELPGILIIPPTSSKKNDGPVELSILRRISIRTNKGVEFSLIFTATTTLPQNINIKAGTSKGIIEELLNHPMGNAFLSIAFNCKEPGQEIESIDPILDYGKVSLNSLINRYAPELSGFKFTADAQYDAAIRLMLASTPHAALKLDDPDQKIAPRSFNTLQEARNAAAAMGNKDVLIAKGADGKYYLYEVTAAQMMRIAIDLRYNSSGENRIKRYNSEITAETLFVNGREMSVKDFIETSYYLDTRAAAEGPEGSEEQEVVVYRMRSSGFYARKQITHAEAVALWKTIDDKITSPDQIAKAMIIPDGIFVSLHAKGIGKFHDIDAGYITGKQHYYKNVEEYDEDVTRVTGDKKEYNPLSYDIYRTAQGDDLKHFLEAQMDSGRELDQKFRKSAKGKNTLQWNLGLVAMSDLHNEANAIAMDIVSQTQAMLNTYIGSDDALRKLLLSMATMSGKDRLDVLSMLGVSDDKKIKYNAILSNPGMAARVAFGVPVGEVSFQGLRSCMNTVVMDTGKLLQQIGSGELQPLQLEGEFGNSIRDEVYKRNGFALKGSDFPHHDKAASFLPYPMEGNGSDFSSVKEQIYVNEVAHMDHAGLIIKILTITAMALAVAAIVILSGGIGAAVAGAFFEAGRAAFVATEIVVSAASMTLLSEGFAQATGGGALSADKEDYGFKELGAEFLKNLALSGVFSGLGRLMSSVKAVYRISAVGIAFLGISLGEYYIRNKKLPEGRELYLFIYENLITLAAIEAGSVLARPLIRGLAIKGNDIRISRLNKRMTDLTTELQLTQTELAEMVAAKKFEEGAALKLLKKQRSGLEKVRDLLTDLQKEKGLNLQMDIAAELNSINEALQKIKLAELQQKVAFMQDPKAENRFSYKPGRGAIKEIINYYGKENVVNKNGVLEVKQPDGSKIIFYPEGKEGTKTAKSTDSKKSLPPAVEKNVSGEEKKTEPKEKETENKVPETTGGQVKKLAPNEAHSVDVNWTNIDSVPGFKIENPQSTVSTAAEFWNATGTDMYDVVFSERFYVKYDTVTGRLLIGDIRNGNIFGFYIDDARVHPTASHTGVIVKDPYADLPNIFAKLSVYHGLTGSNKPLNGVYSSGAAIVATEGVTTTIIGSFKVIDGQVVHMDMPALFDNFGNLKNADFGAKPGGFNVLNVGDGMYEPGVFFEQYNRPWLEQAIARGDIFYAASDPTNDIFIYERDSQTGDWKYIVDKDTGAKTRKRTGFGKEVQILLENGYKYDPTTRTFKK